ncbi:threonine dehydratase [Thermotoga sp. Cell2]|uniref:threonine ammonia-lyase n=1 Tax=Thermotoga sp. Cell2 TaxID=1157947 RepID=UPI0005407531|nr:threonine ammonia-lyase [Thermotoga sp. Cell2]AIY87914.1 threonine dehydratase [Thermotoga sp. Cell2]
MITLEDIKEAQRTLKNVVHRTALAYSSVLSEVTGGEIYLKMENLQKTGSFKIRGAYNKIAHLSEEERKRGVVAASAGNHAQGVALAAQIFGIPATIVMPKYAPLSKITKTRNLGAQVILEGNIFDEAYEAALRIQEKIGAVFVHPFNDPHVIAGQGTIGLEIMEDLPDVEVVVVPVGGGGLISGVSVAIKSMNPEVKVIGVQTENMPSMIASLRRGRAERVEGKPTLADGIAVKKPGDLTFELVKKYVDEMVVVNEEEIADAILFLLEQAKVVAEGAGAVGVAAVLNKLDVKGKKVAIVISGGNIDVNMIDRIINKGLVKSGRKVFIETFVMDRPGALKELLGIVAELGANVLSVFHNRSAKEVPIGFAKIELELETVDEKHVEEIERVLIAKGYEVRIVV